MDTVKNNKRPASSSAETPAQRPASSSAETPAQSPTTVKKQRVYSSATKRAKLESDRRRQQTRVNIGVAFEKWKTLRESLGMTKDPQLASLLLECFERHTLSKGPLKSTPHGPSAKVLLRPRPPSSLTAGESDRVDFQIAGVEPLAADQGLQSLEESSKSMELKDDRSYLTSRIGFEGDGVLVPYDSDYVPPISLRGASQNVVDKLPCIKLEEADLEVYLEEEAAAAIPIYPKPYRVVVESDLINQQACIQDLIYSP